jgi:DNA polymerase-3 subunit epsilon
LVKELQPLFNKQLRRQKLVTLASRHRDRDGYFHVGVHDSREIDPTEAGSIMAVYPSMVRSRAALQTMVRNFGLCAKLMGLEKGSGACFGYQLSKCQGACAGLETASAYNDRLEEAFRHSRLHAWPFTGPILVTEQHGQLEGSEGLVVDQWCLVKRLREYDEGVDETAVTNEFDLDTYKILRRYLSDPANRRSIKRLESGTSPSFAFS